MIEWIQEVQDSGAWFDPNTFASLYGGFGGAFVGLVGGLIGAAIGVLAPQGKGRRFFQGALVSLGALGVFSLVFGLIALFSGQPRGIWYSPVLLGSLCASLGFIMSRKIGRIYDQSEQRRLQAESLRRG